MPNYIDPVTGITMPVPQVRLDVGSGSEPKPGFTGVDLFAEGVGIVKAPMWELPYEDETVDEIYCSHALEHVEKRKIIPTLQEFNRVLKLKGWLEIEVPNLAWCCDNWMKHPDNGWNLDAIFGNQDDAGQFHMTGFTHQIMMVYMTASRFIRSDKDYLFFKPVWSHEQECLHFKVEKKYTYEKPKGD